MNLGKILSDIRSKNNLTMDELADILNKKYNLKITKSMISRWENNKTAPSLVFIQAYAKEFGIDLNYLLGLIDKEIPSKTPDFDLGTVKLNKIARYAKDLTEAEQDTVLNVVEALRRAKSEDDRNDDNDEI